jgi:mRNA interferase MazF
MAATTNYQAGEILLANVPFSIGRRSKVRPCLVVLDTGDDDVVIAKMTSQPPTGPFDVVLAAWAPAGLLGSAVARMHKLITIHKKTLIVKRIGHLQPADRQAAAVILRQILGNW